MKKSVRKELLKRLQSGEYIQCQGSLKRNGADTQEQFCINGLICDIVDPEGWVNSGSIPFHRSKLLFPSESVLALADLTKEECERFAEMNDNGYDFNRFAQYIEENFPKEEMPLLLYA